jgi:hypothetical protein
MLDAARRADGPRHHLDIGAALPPIDGVAVQVDSLISWPGSWRLSCARRPAGGATASRATANGALSRSMATTTAAACT